MVISLLHRECFVDGDVKGESLDELFTSRANYLSKNYGDRMIQTIMSYCSRISKNVKY